MGHHHLRMQNKSCCRFGSTPAVACRHAMRSCVPRRPSIHQVNAPLLPSPPTPAHARTHGHVTHTRQSRIRLANAVEAGHPGGHCKRPAHLGVGHQWKRRCIHLVDACLPRPHPLRRPAGMPCALAWSLVDRWVAGPIPGADMPNLVRFPLGWGVSLGLLELARHVQVLPPRRRQRCPIPTDNRPPLPIFFFFFFLDCGLTLARGQTNASRRTAGKADTACTGDTHAVYEAQGVRGAPLR